MRTRVVSLCCITLGKHITYKDTVRGPRGRHHSSTPENKYSAFCSQVFSKFYLSGWAFIAGCACCVMARSLCCLLPPPPLCRGSWLPTHTRNSVIASAKVAPLLRCPRNGLWKILLSLQLPLPPQEKTTKHRNNAAKFTIATTTPKGRRSVWRRCPSSAQVPEGERQQCRQSYTIIYISLLAFLGKKSCTGHRSRPLWRATPCNYGRSGTGLAAPSVLAAPCGRRKSGQRSPDFAQTPADAEGVRGRAVR